MGSVLRDFQQHWLNETFLVQGFTMVTLTAVPNFSILFQTSSQHVSFLAFLMHSFARATSW